jgi:Peptidase A4 family
VIGIALVAVLNGSAKTSSTPPPRTVPIKETTASQNWAGYVVRGRTFSGVSASWVVPAVKTPATGYSAFWVGLGGSGGTSTALEQAGTESDYVNGKATYVAWYELVPAPSRAVALTIRPGDRMRVEVGVSGTKVTVTISDETTGKTVTKGLQKGDPDTSTAEWIAEAPSMNGGHGKYRILPLANYGTVRFSDAVATAGTHTGPIDDAYWAGEKVDLVSASPSFSGPGPGYAGPPPPITIAGSTGADAEESTSGVADRGSAFSVAWRPTGPARDLRPPVWLVD